MKYDKALREWGARKIEEFHRGVSVDRDSVAVELEFDEGYACCGGADPECYCSFAESPSVHILVTGKSTAAKSRKTYSREIDSYAFGFESFLQELLSVAGDNKIT